MTFFENGLLWAALRGRSLAEAVPSALMVATCAADGICGPGNSVAPLVRPGTLRTAPHGARSRPPASGRKWGRVALRPAGTSRSDRTVRHSAGDGLPHLATQSLARSASEAVDFATLAFLLLPVAGSERAGEADKERGGGEEGPHGVKTAALKGQENEFLAALLSRRRGCGSLLPGWTPWNLREPGPLRLLLRSRRRKRGGRGGGRGGRDGRVFRVISVVGMEQRSQPGTGLDRA